MGKPYLTELNQLHSVYAWANEQDIAPLSHAVMQFSDYPLEVVGSGGSATVAHLASFLHQYYALRLATALTPLEAVYLSRLRDSSILLLSAGGRNPDIIGAFRHLVLREPRHLVVLCSARESLLAKAAASFWYVNLIEHEPPTGKDGFVATNTLLSSVILLARAYAEAFGTLSNLPKLMDELFGAEGGLNEVLFQLKPNSAATLSRDTLLVLYGPAARPAALDIESKFSEGALGPVQLADFRNFAHGRHQWLAKRASKTGVLALITQEDSEIAERTLELLPSQVPVTRLRIPWRRVEAAIASIVLGLHWVGLAGTIRGIDPGSPTVSRFGRQLYRMNVFGPTIRTYRNQSAVSDAAIERKSGATIEVLERRGALCFWQRALQEFLSGLLSTNFPAIVFDYDGTLCSLETRYHGIAQPIAQQLTRLLETGLILGIATGRGGSARRDLCRMLERKYWDRVFVGYYNGAQVGTLGEDGKPDVSAPPSSDLCRMVDWLTNDRKLMGIIDEIECRPNQISIRPKPAHQSDAWSLIHHYSVINGQSVVRSTHSMDILGKGVSKNNLLAFLQTSICGADAKILRIGDLGAWPGNDFELLADRFGLSVDETSPDPATCWNIGLPGHRGVQVTLDYLNVLVSRGSSVCFDGSRLTVLGQK